MELFIFRPDEWERMYSCRNISVDAVPLAERKQMTNGIVTIVLYAIFEILTVPCVIVLYKHLRDENSCYKLMFVIAVVDFFVLHLVGLFTAVLGMSGTTFCERPSLIYVVGCVLQALWSLSTTGNVVLAVNRCLDFIFPRVCAALFAGPRTWVWVGAMLCYFFVYLLDVNIVFCPMFFTWFYSPYMGYANWLNENYFYPLDVFQNYLVGFGLPGIYFGFSVLLALRLSKFSEYMSISVEHKLIFLQVFLISAINFVTAGAWVIMAYGWEAPWLFLFDQYAWFFSHGIPPAIYLTLNKTIRGDVRALFKRCSVTHRNKHNLTNTQPQRMRGGVTISRALHTIPLQSSQQQQSQLFTVRAAMRANARTPPPIVDVASGGAGGGGPRPRSMRRCRMSIGGTPSDDAERIPKPVESSHNTKFCHLKFALAIDAAHA